MAEDAKSFSSTAPMLFGEEIAKQATATAEQVKAMNIPLEKKSHFFGYHCRSYQSSRGGGTKSGYTRYQPYYKGTGQTAQSNCPVQLSSPTVQDRTTKIKETETSFKSVCELSKEIINCHHTLNLSVILPSIKGV